MNMYNTRQTQNKYHKCLQNFGIHNFFAIFLHSRERQFQPPPMDYFMGDRITKPKSEMLIFFSSFPLGLHTSKIALNLQQIKSYLKTAVFKGSCSRYLKSNKYDFLKIRKSAKI